MNVARRSRTAHRVRIVGGDWRRTPLPVLDAPGLRPTPDRVRETLFNWLGQRLDGWRCVDAFAGSGALAFEAASRGAAEVIAIDSQPRVVLALERLRERLGADTVRLVRGDAIEWLEVLRRERGGEFDLVFLDPPFDSDLLEPALALAAALVRPGGYIYVETGKPLGAASPTSSCGQRSAAGCNGAETRKLVELRRGRAGQVYYHLLQRTEPQGD